MSKQEPGSIRKSEQWKRIHRACTREISVWEFGPEAGEVANRVADMIMHEQAFHKATQQPEMLDITKEVAWPKPSPKRLP